jgi:pyruvate dehydrogenase E1 component alpha subunit
MVEIRLFEDKVQELFNHGLVPGTTHLCQGQEAVSVGAVSAMRPDDYLTINYRGHGHSLARGLPLEQPLASSWEDGLAAVTVPAAQFQNSCVQERRFHPGRWHLASMRMP